MVRAGGTPRAQGARQGFGQAVAVFAGFGAGQARAGGQHVEGGVDFQVVKNEQALLCGAGQPAFTSAAAAPLAGPLLAKTRPGFLLAARRERLDQGTKRF